MCVRVRVCVLETETGMEERSVGKEKGKERGIERSERIVLRSHFLFVVL